MSYFFCRCLTARNGSDKFVRKCLKKVNICFASALSTDIQFNWTLLHRGCWQGHCFGQTTKTKESSYHIDNSVLDYNKKNKVLYFLIAVWKILLLKRVEDFFTYFTNLLWWRCLHTGLKAKAINILFHAHKAIISCSQNST